MKNYPITVGRGTPCLKKTLGYRRQLVWLLLLLLPPAVAAQGTNSYSFNFKNTPYESVFKQVGEQTGYNFFYSNADLLKLKPLNLSVSNVDLNTLLSKVFSGTGLNYEVKSNKTIVVKASQEPQPTVAATEIKPEQAHKTITGTITDSGDKRPLPFVGITVKEVPNFHAATDDAGRFSFTLPANAKTLVFNFIGYEKMEVPVGNQSTFSVALASTSLALDETIVIGYQTRKKSTLTGSVKALDAVAVQDRPVANFDAALQGQVAGMYVTSSGDPGKNGLVYIRGINSLGSGREPLYILDGTPISTENFATLNANDIETYTVLKDASATSIYGSMAANGVVLLTSKRGRNMDRSEIFYNFQGGMSTIVPRKFDMMSTAQLLQYQEELGTRTLDPTGKYYMYYDSKGNAIRESKDSLLNINTNWEDEIFRTGYIQSHELGLRGGNQNTRYYLSLNYFSQDGILPHSSLDRIALRVNLDHTATKFLKIGASNAISRDKRSEVVTGNTFINSNPLIGSYMYPPYLKARNDDGELIEFPENTTYKNILLYYDNYGMKSSFTKIVNNLYAEMNIASWLKFKSTVGVDAQMGTQYTYQNPDPNNSDPTKNGSVSRAYTGYTATTNTNLFTFQNTFADNHNLTMLLGEESMYIHSSEFSAGGQGLYDRDLMMLKATSTALNPKDNEQKWTTLSFFSQLSYNFKNKYFVDLSFRTDAKSQFADAHKWASFGAIGISWNAKREDFFKDSKLVSALNVFASTGTTGNADFRGNPTYDYYGYNASYNDVAGLTRTQIANEDLRWESVRKNNIGVEATLVDRVRVKAEVYSNITSDALVPAPISSTYGVSTQLQNAAKMRNRGVELELEVRLLQAKELRWNIRGNVAYNKIKVLELNTEGKKMDYGSYLNAEGLNYGTFYLTRYAGVDPLNGQPLWYTKDDKITTTYSADDRVLMGKSFIPDYTGGFGSDFTYKRFNLSVFFTWTGNRYMLNRAKVNYDSDGNYASLYNQGVDMLDYWKKPGDVTPNHNPNYPSVHTDTRYLDNAAFLRLKDVSISYTLDESYLAKTKLIKSARIYLQAQNLLTFTSYTGFDPETPAALEMGNYPHSRTFTLGLDLKF